MRRLVAAPDKFKGTATAPEVAGSIARAARRAGWEAAEVPMADGGEGVLEVLGGRPRHARVQGPLGQTVEAEWRMRGTMAVIESARASGLALVGGPHVNDALEASTRGTGELVMAAIAAGARRIILGLGGSATTDGGLGAVRAIESKARLKGVELVVACDVSTTFVDAAAVFAPQKGATPAQVSLLTRRLERLAQLYRETYGVDVRDMAGSGAAGGLAGGLAAVGAELVPGFDLFCEATGLAEIVEGSSLVVTGEGRLDEQSLRGKVVGGVVGLSRRLGVPALVVAGQIPPGDLDDPVRDIPSVSLSETYGIDRSMSDPLGCAEDAVRRYLDRSRLVR